MKTRRPLASRLTDEVVGSIHPIGVETDSFFCVLGFTTWVEIFACLSSFINPTTEVVTFRLRA